MGSEIVEKIFDDDKNTETFSVHRIPSFRGRGMTVNYNRMVILSRETAK